MIRVMMSLLYVALVCEIGLAAESKQPVTITFDESKTFPFPEKILGAQDEIFTLPYLFNSQFQGYKALGITMLRYPCGTPSDWLAWDDVDNGYWPSDFEKKTEKNDARRICYFL